MVTKQNLGAPGSVIPVYMFALNTRFPVEANWKYVGVHGFMIERLKNRLHFCTASDEAKVLVLDG